MGLGQHIGAMQARLLQSDLAVFSLVDGKVLPLKHEADGGPHRTVIVDYEHVTHLQRKRSKNRRISW
jgi:hypothetical protein